MAKTKRQILEEERRQRRKADDRKIQRYIDESGLKTKVESLNDWDRWQLLDRLNGV